MGQVLDQQTLKRLLNYDPVTGAFTWRELSPRCHIVKAGDPAGGPDGHGYLRIRILGRLQYAQRLAWLYMTGSWPAVEVDHRNTIRDDNRWANLREATDALNAENRRKPYANSKTGKLGVLYKKDRDKYRARIMVRGKSIHLGDHDTAELAHAAYLKAKRELHEGCTL